MLTFDSPSIEWAKFILANRKRSKEKFVHDYDIVVGPVADDGVAFQLERYLYGGMTLEQLAKELTYRKLNRQYFFGTEKAISYLQQIWYVSYRFIKSLSKKQREDYMIMDDQYFSFDASSKIYSIKDILKY